MTRLFSDMYSKFSQLYDSRIGDMTYGPSVRFPLYCKNVFIMDSPNNTLTLLINDVPLRWPNGNADGSDVSSNEFLDLSILAGTISLKCLDTWGMYFGQEGGFQMTGQGDGLLNIETASDVEFFSEVVDNRHSTIVFMMDASRIQISTRDAMPISQLSLAGEFNFSGSSKLTSISNDCRFGRFIVRIQDSSIFKLNSKGWEFYDTSSTFKIENDGAPKLVLSSLDGVNFPIDITNPNAQYPQGLFDFLTNIRARDNGVLVIDFPKVEVLGQIINYVDSKHLMSVNGSTRGVALINNNLFSIQREATFRNGIEITTLSITLQHFNTTSL
jgi:hypothetical protein